MESNYAIFILPPHCRSLLRGDSNLEEHRPPGKQTESHKCCSSAAHALYTKTLTEQTLWCMMFSPGKFASTYFPLFLSFDKGIIYVIHMYEKRFIDCFLSFWPLSHVHYFDPVVQSIVSLTNLLRGQLVKCFPTL